MLRALRLLYSFAMHILRVFGIGTVSVAVTAAQVRHWEETPTELIWRTVYGAGAAEHPGAGPTEAGAGDSVYRGDAGSRPQGATETTAHGTSDLEPTESGTPRSGDRRIDGAAVRASAQARNGLGARGGVRSTKLPVGAGRPGGLVRGLGRDRWGGTESVPVLHAGAWPAAGHFTERTRGAERAPALHQLLRYAQ